MSVKIEPISDCHRKLMDAQIAVKLKPQIPLLGDDDIPIKHEFEFELAL